MRRRQTLATYSFETITAAQALSFNGASDTLEFTASAETGATERLLFNADGTITVFSNIGGHQATFGPGLAGAAQILFADGSQILVGSPGGDVLTGGPHGDGLFGGLGADTLVGGAGDDALEGGPGADVLTGGGGRNLFLFDHDSPPVVGQMDTITDWNSGDALSFFSGPVAASSYMESTAADVSSAKAFAAAEIAGGTAQFVSEQVGADVIVFAGSQGVVSDAVILAGRTLADIDASNIVTSATFPHASTTPPPTSPPPVVVPGVTAVIGGDLDPSALTSVLDNPTVTFSPTVLSLQTAGASITLTGSGFTLDADENLTGGTLTGVDFTIAGAHAHITGISTPIAPLADLLDEGGDFMGAIFSGSDSIVADSSVNTLHGYDGNDTIQALGGQAYMFGDSGADSLVGGAGADTLVGGYDADIMSGGAGANVFVFDTIDSLSVRAQGGHLEALDQITDWTASDYLQFLPGGASAGSYAEITATSYDQAMAIAESNSTMGINYTAAQLGSDVVVFWGGDGGDAVVLQGRTLADISQANVGNDLPAAPPSGSGVLQASAGNATVQGGTGDDTIIGATTSTSDYLRGGDGDDSIQGGVGFDDINGNKGNDTIQGDLTVGNDWLVGGQNNDSITAHAGANLLYGNLGNDTLQGGGGADILRGGQGDDIVFAGSGNQFLSGDRGDDTITAGPGNDTIHSSQDAGIDRILGFNAGHDVVELDPGTVFTVAQVGADTVITMTGSPGTNEVILVGVPMSSLTGNWIFGA